MKMKPLTHSKPVHHISNILLLIALAIFNGEAAANHKGQSHVSISE